MGDMRDVYDEMRRSTQQRKEQRRQENLQHLAANSIPWVWVDNASDHILINGEIDYYLGKTYWFNRKTGKRGYTPLNRLIGTKE